VFIDLGPLRRSRGAGHQRRPGLQSVVEGLRFVRGRQVIQGAYLIDINAMVFGMPRALFPALADALTTGWVSRIRRQGLAVIVAVITWGIEHILVMEQLLAGYAGVSDTSNNAQGGP
jgi:hypothetical protein